MDEGTINSVSDLIELRTQFDEKWWFRGQSMSEWHLQPKVFRHNYFAKDERAMLSEFRQGASFRSGVHPDGSWEWCVFAQHYGIPTRLLDWTLNPLQALFFAVEKSDVDHDDSPSAFFALDARGLNQRVLGQSVSFPLLLETSETTLNQYLPGSEKSDGMPVAVIAESTFSRINAQHGAFTIIPNKTYQDDTMGNTCKKWIIPKESKAQIRKELEFLYINDSTTYPDLEHFARRITLEHSDTENL